MTSSLNTDAFRSLTKHKTYYITGADLCLLVEDVYFRVHRYFLERESAYFIRKLATPASPGQQPQGTQDANAIILENVSVEHFATFLWVFYNPLYSLYDAKTSDWEVILELSVRWEFPEVKNLAVRELEKKDIPDSKRIKLYHANSVDRNVLIPRYAAMCERDEPLTFGEGQDIGMETVLMIAAGREAARAGRLTSGGRSPLSPTVRGAELHDVVREVFNITPETSSTTDATGGLPIHPTKTAKKSMAQTAPVPMTHPKPATIQKGGRPTAAITTPNLKKPRMPLDSAVKQDGLVAEMVDVGSSFETKLDATEGNMISQGIGSNDDLLGLFGFNQTSSPAVPPPSVFDSISFSNFGASWS